MLPMGTGYIVMPGGPGFRITIGDGPLFIMAAGFMKRVMDGYGYRGTNGHPPGLPGVIPVLIMDGHRSGQKYTQVMNGHHQPVPGHLFRRSILTNPISKYISPTGVPM